jgi:ABC-type multidrug transport system fused ATPase/permease subunit
MGFLFDGLDAEKFDRKYNDRELVMRIVSYFRPHRRKMIAVAFMIVITSLASTALPVVISRGLDALQADPSTQTIVGFAVLATVLASLSWLFNFVRRWLSAEAVGDVVYKVREDAFDAVLKRDLSFYDEYASGKIVSRVTSDTQAFSTVVTLAMDLISQLLLVLLLFGYLFSIDASMTLILVLLTPFIFALALAFRRVARFTITQTRRIRAEVSSLVQETISGISVAKTFRQEQAIYDEFSKLNERAFRINVRTGYVFSAIFPLLNSLAGSGTAA